MGMNYEDTCLHMPPHKIINYSSLQVFMEATSTNPIQIGLATTNNWLQTFPLSLQICKVGRTNCV
jgi:hypothetical protein